jgi:hypothetical protein
MVIVVEVPAIAVTLLLPSFATYVLLVTGFTAAAYGLIEAALILSYPDADVIRVSTYNYTPGLIAANC